MPKPTYATCRACGAHRDDVGLLSHTRLCGPCAKRILLDNIDGLHEHKGEPMQRWRRGMVACAGGILMDDLEAMIAERLG